MTNVTSTPNPDHIAERAWALIELRRWKEAMAEAQRVLQLDPRHFNGLYNLTVAQRHAGDPVAAEQTARTLVGYYPNSASGYNMLSRALKAQKRYTDAIAASREAVRLSPNDADLWINLSDVLMSAKLFNEGAQACQKAIELNPTLPMAHNNYAVGLEEFHLDQNAEAEYRKAMELDPLNPLFHSNLGWLKYKQKQFAAAVDHFHKAVQLDPAKREYQNSLKSALRKSYPIGPWLKLARVLLIALPVTLLLVAVAMGLPRPSWLLLISSVAFVVAYGLFISTRIEHTLRERYARRRLNMLGE